LPQPLPRNLPEFQQHKRCEREEKRGKPNQKVEVTGETPMVYIKVPPPRVIGKKEAEDLPEHTKVIRGVEPDDI
jgi:hypothetical protein